MDAAKRLKELRLARNLTTTELAARCNLPQSTISKLENDKRIIDIPTLTVLCRELDITLADFFYYQQLPIHLYELLVACKNLTPNQAETIIQCVRAFDNQGV